MTAPAKPVQTAVPLLPGHSGSYLSDRTAVAHSKAVPRLSVGYSLATNKAPDKAAD